MDSEIHLAELVVDLGAIAHNVQELVAAATPAEVMAVVKADGYNHGLREVVEAIREAGTTPPQTTRAKLRGDFVRAAQEHHRDFSVDWVHLKLNDSSQRTVLCKDPFVSQDPRIDELIASMGQVH